MGKILIRGNKEFIRRTKIALYLLKEKDNIEYKNVINYIGKIEMLDYAGGMDVFKEIPTAYMGKSHNEESIYWHASCIVHEAHHSKLYFTALEEGRDGIKEYAGHIAEMYCLTKQIETLKKIGAPREIIEYATTLYDSKWYEIPASKRYW